MSQGLRTPGIRSPAVAGAFYPRDANELRVTIKDCFVGPRGPGPLRTKAETGRNERSMVAGIVPHAGYIYSGPVAAHFYRELSRERTPKTVLILGVNHHGVGGLFSLSDSDWRTPLGVVESDQELLRALAEPPIEVDAGAHRLEHSIEVELPFLQYLWGKDFSLVALQISFTELSLLKEVGRMVDRATHGKDVLLLASTDLSHYLPPEEAARWDDRAISSLMTLSPDNLYETVVGNDISMCGIAPSTVLLSALAGREHEVRLLKQGNSGDAEPMDSVVGYASLAITRKP